MQKISTLSVVAPVPLSEAEQQQMGQQLTEQYHKTQLAALEVITFGAMFLQAEETIGATCGTDTDAANQGLAKDGKRLPKGSGFKGWLATYAKDITYGTARRYRDIAEAMQGELKLKSVEQLKLIAGDAKDLDPKLAKKRADLVDIVADKSVRGLQLELGLVDPPAERGGAHGAKGKITPAGPIRPPCPRSVKTQAMRDHYAALSDQQAIAFCAVWPVEIQVSHVVEANAPLALHDVDRDRLRALVTRLAAQVGIKLPHA